MVEGNVHSKNGDGNPAGNSKHAMGLEAHLLMPHQQQQGGLLRVHTGTSVFVHITSFKSHDSPKMGILLSLFYT